MNNNCEKCKGFICYCRFGSSPVSEDFFTTQDIEKKQQELYKNLKEKWDERMTFVNFDRSFEIVPHDPKDEKIAKQMTQLIKHYFKEDEFCQECKNEKIACVCMGENKEKL